MASSAQPASNRRSRRTGHAGPVPVMLAILLLLAPVVVVVVT